MMFEAFAEGIYKVIHNHMAFYVSMSIEEYSGVDFSSLPYFNKNKVLEMISFHEYDFALS